MGESDPEWERLNRLVASLLWEAWRPRPGRSFPSCLNRLVASLLWEARQHIAAVALRRVSIAWWRHCFGNLNRLVASLLWEATEYHACRVCNSTPRSEPGTCSQCEEHERLGRKLLDATHLAILHGDSLPDVPAREDWFTDAAKELDLCAALLTEDEAGALLTHQRGQSNPADLLLFSLHETKFLPDAPPSVGQGFRFLAKAAPRPTEDLSRPDMGEAKAGDVLPFEGIAHLSRGTALLGVLKADVDHLGLLLGAGTTDKHPPTLARLSAQSFAVDLFFCGWLDTLCKRLSADWRQRHEQRKAKAAKGLSAHKWHDKVEGLFYVLYAGGDDLLLVGPWDAVMGLAGALRKDFARYVCGNPNVTLSAGLVLVKPRYPVHRFAKAADEALEQAKNERDRISIFRQSVPWTEPLQPTGYDKLLELGHSLLHRLEEGEEGRKLPRTLLHDLGRLAREGRGPIDGDKKPKASWRPSLYYTLARRMDRRDAEVVGRQILDLMHDFQRIVVPISYASYATRKEG